VKLPTQRLYETVSQGIVALTNLDGTINMKKERGEGLILEEALKEAIINAFHPTPTLKDDPSVQSLVSIIQQGDVDDPIAAEKAIDILCYRSWYLDKEEALSSTLLPRLASSRSKRSKGTVERFSIPDDSVIDRVRFSHEVSGESKDFGFTSDLDCLTTGGALSFPIDKLVYPKNAFKLDCATGLTCIDGSLVVTYVSFTNFIRVQFRVEYQSNVMHRVSPPLCS
jgi:hypothetical protein